MEEHELIRMRAALEEVSQGKVTALSDGDNVVLMIQNAPEELRKLADAMERIGISQMKAFVAYAKPELKDMGKLKARKPKPREQDVEQDTD